MSGKYLILIVEFVFSKAKVKIWIRNFFTNVALDMFGIIGWEINRCQEHDYKTVFCRWSIVMVGLGLRYNNPNAPKSFRYNFKISC